MTSVQRNRTTHLSDQASRLLAQGFFAVGLAALGGCSADITRFDFPAFNLTESSNTQTGSLSRPGSEPLAQRGPGYYDGPRGAGLSDEMGRGYPPQQPNQSGRGQPSTTLPSAGTDPGSHAARAHRHGHADGRAPVAERRWRRRALRPAARRSRVQPGDTLFGIAKRHGVQVAP
jgi:hypothetical protein